MNARPAPIHPLKELPVPLRAVPEPETVAAMYRVARRHSQRLHMARMGVRYLPHPNQHEVTPACKGCGGELSSYVLGCVTCLERRLQRERRSLVG